MRFNAYLSEACNDNISARSIGIWRSDSNSDVFVGTAVICCNDGIWEWALKYNIDAHSAADISRASSVWTNAYCADVVSLAERNII